MHVHSKRQPSGTPRAVANATLQGVVGGRLGRRAEQGNLAHVHKSDVGEVGKLHARAIAGQAKDPVERHGGQHVGGGVGQQDRRSGVDVEFERLEELLIG